MCFNLKVYVCAYTSICVVDEFHCLVCICVCACVVCMCVHTKISAIHLFLHTRWKYVKNSAGP